LYSSSGSLAHCVCFRRGCSSSQVAQQHEGRMKTAIFPIQINIDDFQLFSGAGVHIRVPHWFCSSSGFFFHRALATATHGRRKAGHDASIFPLQPVPGWVPGASHTPPPQLGWPGSTCGHSSPFLMSGVFLQVFLAGNKHQESKFITEMVCREQSGDPYLPMQQKC